MLFQKVARSEFVHEFLNLFFVHTILNLLGPGPSWSGISKFFSLLVQAGARFSLSFGTDWLGSVDP